MAVSCAGVCLVYPCEKWVIFPTIQIFIAIVDKFGFLYLCTAKCDNVFH